MATAEMSTIHGKTVTIRGERWRFKIVEGRQYVRGEGETEYTQYKAIRHSSNHTITIASIVPAEEQFQLAGEELMLILTEPRKARKGAGRGRAKKTRKGARK